MSREEIRKAAAESRILAECGPDLGIRDDEKRERGPEEQPVDVRAELIDSMAEAFRQDGFVWICVPTRNRTWI